jgi:hypothetical protein
VWIIPVARDNRQVQMGSDGTLNPSGAISHPLLIVAG